MNVLTLTLLVYVFGLFEYKWIGAAVAWMFAVILDTVLVAWVVYCVTQKGG